MAARVLDPEILARSPRAPSEEEWRGLSPEQRALVIRDLPAHLSDLEFLPPEGDPHREAKSSAFEVLREYFRTQRRSVYVAADLTVYYPAVQRFAPDVFAVLDVDPHPRMKWVVSAEGKGLDWVLEVHVAGNRRKDLETNLEFYAQLGIPEYFIFEVGKQRLSGYELPGPGNAYRPIVPQGGRYRSATLELDLAVEGERIRFYSANAMLLQAPEVIAQLQRYSDAMTQRAEEEARRAEEEARRADEEAQRAEEEARRSEDLARRVAELEAELRRRGP